MLFWNQGATDLYGWTEPEVRNLPMTTLMIRVPSAFDAHRAEVVEKGFWRGELHHINKQGQEVIVSSRWTLVRDETGSPNGFLIINTDLTDRKRLEDQIQRVKRLETVGTLAGGIAHDFNNILGAILSFVDLAIQDAPPTAHSVKGDMQEIKRAALRAKELVNQVLTFSRQDANPRQPFQPVRLQSIIREALRLIRASAPMGVEIIEKLDPTAPMILAEPTQMHQVVMNLCTNAVQAMSSGKGILTIRLTSAPLSETMVSGLPNLKAGWYAILSVSDTGHGIPQEIRDRIFDPFFTTKPPGVGTGLGLSVVHGIIEAHQGAISVQSGQDQGTIFTVYLPTAYEKQNYQEGLSAGRALPPKPDEAETQTTLPLSVALPGAGQRIMVVDDEHALAVATRRSLERCGFKVTEFSQSIQAWEAFEANPGNYDLILTDLSMPGLGGLELAKKMYALRPELPIIISTGNPPEESQEELKTLGIRKLIQKPCPVRILAETIQQILTPSP